MAKIFGIGLSKTGHYDDVYFAWQEEIGAFFGTVNRRKYQPFIKPADRVLDFGCGGGFLLNNIECGARAGVEINPAARARARSLGIDSVPSVDEIPDDWADVVVSNNALEHVHHPLTELRALLPKVRRGGRVVFFIPCEHIGYSYKPGDINQHLYSWSPMCAGNLFTLAGYQVVKSEKFITKAPPKSYRAWHRVLGPGGFYWLCRLYGHFERSWFQVRVIATRP